MIFIIIFLPASLAIEFTRESVVYELNSQKLESAYQTIELGMNKEQVEMLLDEPHSTTKNELGEVWSWNSGNYQGFLWKRVGLATVKGHFGISLLFGEDNRVYKKFGGVN